jgi:triosephosphate isomerase
MNAGGADGVALAKAVTAAAVVHRPVADMVVCPPAVALGAVGREIAGSIVALGAQDCHWDAAGAHTGDISAPMLVEAGVRYVIVGHSERRTDHGESDDMVRRKAAAAHAAGLSAIICIGETEAERDAGETLDVLSRQIAGSLPDGAAPADTVIAYEPIWAIGTGRTPTDEEVAAAHAHIRARLAERVANAADVRILYGGSVNPGNAAALLSIDNVDGALVGGASLDAESFSAIAEALS